MHSETAAHVLIVVAHPDDEVLGAGGAVAVLTSRGIQVTACILSAGVDARQHHPGSSELAEDTMRAAEILGMCAPILGTMPNIQMNTIPHIDLVRFIERAIARTGATEIFTHHPGDLNNDHQQVSVACQAAARAWQRGPGLPPLMALHFMEIASSTDWAFPGGSTHFAANSFFALGPLYLEKKLEALAAYRSVMRPFPHPRSPEVIRGMAAIRGGQSGFEYAEGFQTVFVDLSCLLR